jgi:hypothetical protein
MESELQIIHHHPPVWGCIGDLWTSDVELYDLLIFLEMSHNCGDFCSD